MSKLERWLPFRFWRKKKEKEPAAEGDGGGEALAHPAAPWTPWPSALMTPAMQQMMEGFFQDPFFREPFGRSDPLERWFGDFSPRRFAPSVEVSDEGGALRITAELPGMSKEDIKLQIDRDALVISGEKREDSEGKHEGLFRTERYYGYFQRAIPLPEDVDREAADAEFERGVLTIRLPKVEARDADRRQIAIRG